MPYKQWYTLSEFWDQLTRGTLWKAYAKANPAESARLADIAGKKIRQEAYMIPNDATRTHTGRALLIAIMSLPGGKPSP
jgi:hypothetical protein